MVYYLGNNVVSRNVPPKCKICGSEIVVKKINNSKFRVVNCSNEKCIANNPNGSHKIKFLMSFGDEALKSRTEKLRKTRITNKEYWIAKGLDEAEAMRKVKEIQSKASKQVKNRGICSRDVMEKKLGKEGANIFFRKKSRLCVEYWTNRGLSEDDAKQKISSLQSVYGNMQDFEHIKERSYRCKEYWMSRSGMTEDEAIKKVSEIQTNFSKEKCIEKYGNDEGIRIWKERQLKWQESLHESQNLHVGFSKVSQELFDSIISMYPDCEKDYVFYGTKNHEYCLRHNETNYIFDFTDLNKRKMIEFNGDIYHGNPLIFEEKDRPNPFKKDKTCKDLWEFDEKKRAAAIANGFELLTIWEKEYRENKAEIIQKCIKFLSL